MPATFGRRRQTASKLRKPVLGTRAQYYPRLRVRLVAVARSYRRRYAWHSSRTHVIGRAVALTFVWPVRVLQRQANRSQQRKRALHSRLRAAIRAPLIVIFPRAVRAYQRIAGRSV